MRGRRGPGGGLRVGTAGQSTESQTGGPREGNGPRSVGEFERLLLFRGVGGAGRERGCEEAGGIGLWRGM